MFHLRRFTGVEFAVTHSEPPTFFIIQKRERLSPDEGKSGCLPIPPIVHSLHTSICSSPYGHLFHYEQTHLPISGPVHRLVEPFGNSFSHFPLSDTSPTQFSLHRSPRCKPRLIFSPPISPPLCLAPDLSGQSWSLGRLDLDQTNRPRKEKLRMRQVQLLRRVAGSNRIISCYSTP